MLLAEEAQARRRRRGARGLSDERARAGRLGSSRLRHGQWDHARRLLTAATRQTPHLTYALPWPAVQARIELADAYVTLRDREAAGHMLEEARGILAVRPDLGLLGEAVARLEPRARRDARGRIAAASSGSRGPSCDCSPLLSTHLSFREIGERLHVSRNTIKTQAISVYRKLGVSSRSEAVAVAEDLGLVEAAELKRDRLGARRGGRVACPLVRPPRRGSAKRRFHPFGMKIRAASSRQTLARR